jgi:hypothetical protein
MKKNFIIADSIAIQTQEGYYDIHNNFYMNELVVDFMSRSTKIRFDRFFDESKLLKKKESLTLIFSNIDYFNISTNFLHVMPRDVEEFGYKSPDDFDHDWLISESDVNEVDHFFIRFSEDEFIRIHGSNIEYTVKKFD